MPLTPGTSGTGRLVAREHDFLERARDPRAMQIELGGAALPAREAHGRGDARARQRVLGSVCVCASASICSRFSSRRRNR